VVGKGNEENISILPSEPTTPIERIEVIRPQSLSTQIEVCFEQWSSEPFNEIIDESVLAEVFNDEMLAPDHMVISLKIDE